MRTIECPDGGDPRFYDLLQFMAAQHARKQADYGQLSDPAANLRASEDVGVPAWKGTWIRAQDKIRRIKQFALSGKLINESVDDSFTDLAAYCLLALILLREAQVAATGSTTNSPPPPEAGPGFYSNGRINLYKAEGAVRNPSVPAAPDPHD